jgi:hypothetical protein
MRSSVRNDTSGQKDSRPKNHHASQLKAKERRLNRAFENGTIDLLQKADVPPHLANAMASHLTRK